MHVFHRLARATRQIPGRLTRLAHLGRRRRRNQDDWDPSATALPTWMRPDCRRPLPTPAGVYRVSVGALVVDVDVDGNSVWVNFDDVPLVLLVLPAMGSTSAGARLWMEDDGEDDPVHAHEFLVGAFKDGDVLTRLHHGPLPALLHEQGALRLRFYRIPVEVSPSSAYSVGYQLEEDPEAPLGGRYTHAYRLYRSPDGRWDVWDVDPPERGAQLPGPPPHPCGQLVARRRDRLTTAIDFVVEHRYQGP